MIHDIIGKKYGLFLDLMAYAIICENNAGQYYPDYAYNHPLFTENMKIYSDASVSDFLRSITVDDSVSFLNAWNEKQDHREKIYISYDSTNKKSQAGDIDCIEVGHSKSGIPDTIFNYSIAYDRNNRVPLFYEQYPGSITDIAQLQQMIEKAKSFGYKNIGFILDRGYFCKENIRYMDENKDMQKLLDLNSTCRRQDMPPYYKINGCIYINAISEIRPDLSFADNKIPYFMPKERSVDIDEPLDLMIAE
jgi:hypothetical protein